MEPSWPSWAPSWRTWGHLGAILAPIFAPVGSKRPQNVCADAVQKKHKTSKNLKFFKVFGVPFFSKFFGECVLCMLARYWRSSAASCRQDVVSCCYVGSTSPHLEPRCANLAPHGFQIRRKGRPGPPKIIEKLQEASKWSPEGEFFRVMSQHRARGSKRLPK